MAQHKSNYFGASLFELVTFNSHHHIVQLGILIILPSAYPPDTLAMRFVGLSHMPAGVNFRAPKRAHEMRYSKLSWDGHQDSEKRYGVPGQQKALPAGENRVGVARLSRQRRAYGSDFRLMVAVGSQR
ncbi:MAG TPA: hypothetical protein VG675_09730 [Bryobacteraceae bacterium]|nr:hypothetical protein [Bryobacteraceae bacterium]